MFWTFIYLFALIGGSKCQENDPFLSRVINTIKIGARFLSSYVNSKQNDTLFSVFEKFGTFHHIHSEENGGLGNFIQLLLKFLGISAVKVEDYAFDGAILLAHTIGNVLTDDYNSVRKQKASSFSEFSPFQYLINQPQVLNLLAQMEDPNLLDFILSESTEKLKDYPAEDVECIPLLVCKMFPFVRGMQRSLKFFMKQERDHDFCMRNSTDSQLCQDKALWENTDSEGRMFFFLPTLKEVIEYGDKCDERFSSCTY